MEFNFQNQIKDYEEKYGQGSSFKIKEGQNKVRLLSETILSIGQYKGNETRKFACYVIDRKDEKIKLAFLPKSIVGMIGDLQMSDEFSFKEVPMPYDITITAKNAGTKEVEYSIQPSRDNVELTEEEKKSFSAQTPINQVVEKIESKKDDKVVEPRAEAKAVDIDDIATPNDLPFS